MVKNLLQMLTELLKHGADVNHVNNEGESVLTIAGMVGVHVCMCTCVLCKV